jgi:hypothetical protein
MAAGCHLDILRQDALFHPGLDADANLLIPGSEELELQFDAPEIVEQVRVLFGPSPRDAGRG